VIFTELGVGEGVPGAYPPANLYDCGFKNVAYGCQNCQNS